MYEVDFRSRIPTAEESFAFSYKPYEREKPKLERQTQGQDPSISLPDFPERASCSKQKRKQYVLRIEVIPHSTHTPNPAIKRKFGTMDEILTVYFHGLLTKRFDVDVRFARQDEDRRFKLNQVVHDGGIVFVDIHVHLGRNFQGSEDAPPFAPSNSDENSKTILGSLQSAKDHRYAVVIFLPRNPEGTIFDGCEQFFLQMQDYSMKDALPKGKGAATKAVSRAYRKICVDQDAQCS